MAQPTGGTLQADPHHPAHHVDSAAHHAANPHTPTGDEAEAAVFRGLSEAERAVEDLVAAGVPRDNVTIINDRRACKRFMKQYVHRDSDRAPHSAAGAVFFGAAGAGVLGLISVLAANAFAQSAVWPTIAAVIGGCIGAAVGGTFGSLAMRTVDDQSIALVEKFSQSGPVVAVAGEGTTDKISLSEIGKILTRRNGIALRLRQQLRLADLHPGDARPDQPAVAH